MTLSQLSSLGYIQETTEGTIPSNPTFQELPVTSISVEEQVMYKDIHYLLDRAASDHFITGCSVFGQIGFELDITAYQSLLIEVLRCGGSQYHNFSFNSTYIAVVISGSDTQINASGSLNFETEGLEAGMFIEFSGFSNSANNGIFHIDSMTSSQLLVSGENTMVNESAGQNVTVNVDDYADSNSDPKSYTFRHYYEEEDGTPIYEYYRGCKIVSMYLNFRIGEIVSGIMTIAGLDKLTSQQSGESLTPFAALNLISVAKDVKKLLLLPSSLGERIFTELDIQIENTTKTRHGQNGVAPYSTLDGDISVFLRGVMYHEDLEIYDRLKAGQVLSLALLMDDGSTTVGIGVNSFRIGNVTKPVRGKNSFVFEPIEAEALRDSNGKLIYLNFIT